MSRSSSRRGFLRKGAKSLAFGGIVGAGGCLEAFNNQTSGPFEDVTWSTSGVSFTLADDHGMTEYTVRHQLADKSVWCSGGWYCGHLPEFGGVVTVNAPVLLSENTNWPSRKYAIDIHKDIVDPSYTTYTGKVPEEYW